jgi:hypothetical protein
MDFLAQEKEFSLRMDSSYVLWGNPQGVQEGDGSEHLYSHHRDDLPSFPQGPEMMEMSARTVAILDFQVGTRKKT